MSRFQGIPHLQWDQITYEVVLFLLKHLHKVHVFWERHKILQNLHSRFVPCSASKIYGGNFAKFVVFSEYMIFNWTKGQLISIWFLVSSNSSKKWTNEFFLLLWRYVLVCFGLFFGRNLRHQKLFLNYLTFK